MVQTAYHEGAAVSSCTLRRACTCINEDFAQTAAAPTRERPLQSSYRSVARRGLQQGPCPSPLDSGQQQWPWRLSRRSTTSTALPSLTACEQRPVVEAADQRSVVCWQPRIDDAPGMQKPNDKRLELHIDRQETRMQREQTKSNNPQQYTHAGTCQLIR